MKESITKFDLEAAFKALDEIEVPVAEKGIKANKPALTEIFSRKSKFDVLFEEYYDMGNTEELTDAKEAREAEIAKAKLARIEKIVDLDAESPDDLLTSYVGKYIMQCPQCMTLFYKNQEDIEKSEEDPLTVNINEVCQHCGNDSGYTLIGKVGEAEAEDNMVDDMSNVDLATTEDDLSLEAPEAENAGDMDAEASADIDLDADLEELDLADEDTEQEEEKTEESFVAHNNTALLEQLDETSNIAAFEVDGFEVSCIDTFEDAGEVGHTLVYTHNGKDIVEVEVWEKALPVLVTKDLYAPNLFNSYYEDFNDFAADLAYKMDNYFQEALTEDGLSNGVGESDFRALISSPEYQKPISDQEVRAMLAMESCENKDLAEKQEQLSETLLDDYYDDVLSDRIENMLYYGKFLNARWVKDAPTVTQVSRDTYKITHHKGNASVLVKFDLSNKKDPTLRFTVNYKIQQEPQQKQFEVKSEFDAQTLVLDILSEVYFDSFNQIVESVELDEGVFDKLKGLKDKAVKAFEKVTGKHTTREAKANFILESACIDPSKLEPNKDDLYIPTDTNRRFKSFALMLFKPHYSNGKTITMAPSTSGGKDLVPALKRCEVRNNYEDIEKLARGYSAKEEYGPGFIFLSEDDQCKKLVFVCQYFNGDIDKNSDQLDKLYEHVKKEVIGDKDIKDAGGLQNQGDDVEPTEDNKLDEVDTAEASDKLSEVDA